MRRGVWDVYVIGIRIPFYFSIFKSDTVTYIANRGITIDFYSMFDP